MQLDFRRVLVIRGKRRSQGNAQRADARYDECRDAECGPPRQKAMKRHETSGDAVAWERSRAAGRSA
jgi:hypothetical protein